MRVIGDNGAIIGTLNVNQYLKNVMVHDDLNAQILVVHAAV